ncbi:MAG: hypothetical protein DRO08_00220 [Thermoprotei archaeon]|nr:MAG: hypothetical protein DRO08_00220 [Thermoprotei archaeon]
MCLAVALEDVEIPVVEAKEADLKIQFREFFKTFKDKQGRLKYWNKILDLAIKGEKSLIVDFPDLLLTKPDLALKVLEEPRIALEYASEALKDIVRSENPELVERTEKFYVRFRNLPRTIPIRKLGADHIEKLVQIEGIITRMTPVIQRLYKAVFKCMECGSETEVIQEGETIEYPEFCSFCEEKRRPRIEGGRKARSQFKLLLHKSKFINMQKIMVQEKPEDVPPGHMPRSVEVILLEDLVDKARPGDRVTVVGVLTVKGERSVKKGTKLTFEMKIEANNLEVSQKVLEEIEISKEDERKILELAKDPKIREKIIQSIAPAIHGYDHIKKAIALLLFGGVPKELPDGTRIRGDIHILLVGDPGVAKSQILQYVARIAPRGLYTSGKGSSAAGLTAAVLKDKSTGEYFLEAGALVLADGGVACLHPETRVIANNEYVKIKDLFGEDRCIKAILNNELIELNYSENEVVGINLKSLTAERAISTIIRKKHWRGKLIKLTLESGYELLLTPDHLLIDGNSLEWKNAASFKPGDMVLSIKKIPSHNNDVYVLDIIPTEWTAIVEGNDFKELLEIINKFYGSVYKLSKISNKRAYIARGKLYINVGLLKQLLKLAEKYNEWRNKVIKYSRKSKSEKIPTTKITPELGYLIGFILGDGHVILDKRRGLVRITQSSKHEPILNKVIKYISKTVGKEPQVRRRHVISNINGRRVESDVVTVTINSIVFSYIVNYFLEDGLKRVFRLPNSVLRAFIAGLIDSDGSISIKKARKNGKIYKVAHVDIVLANIEQAKAIPLILRRFDIYSRIKRAKNVVTVQITCRKDVEKLTELIKPYSLKASLASLPPKIKAIPSRENVIPRKISIEIARKLITSIRIYDLVKSGAWSTLYNTLTGRRLLTKEWIRNNMEKYCNDNLAEDLKALITLAISEDYYLDKVINVETINYEGPVYDLYVPNIHNFLAEGIIVHNCIDEIDKMRPEDRVAIHEAMEQQTISIAKAGIVARLNARAAILAAGNPKFGRYIEDRLFTENINLPPTILSRFDLIFVMRDKPEPRTDEELVSHILTVHKQYERVKPPISPSMLRKYIGYARKFVKPRLTEEAAKIISEFFVNLRSKASEHPNAPIPITPRQLEAIIRLAEAHARMVLRNEVTAEDAKAAIDLMVKSFKDVGLDIEAGVIDIDVIMTGKPLSRRSKMMKVMEIIEKIEEYPGAEVRKSDVVEQAVKAGLSAEEVEEIIEQLRRDGILYEPKPGRTIARTV